MDTNGAVFVGTGFLSDTDKLSDFLGDVPSSCPQVASASGKAASTLALEAQVQETVLPFYVWSSVGFGK